MSEPAFLDRRVPSLLDRLVSYADGIENRLPPPNRRAALPSTLREMSELVRIDLRTLLSTSSLPLSSPVYEFPLVAASVINYGVCDFRGHSLDSPVVERLTDAVKQAIRWFEPRVVRGTLRVDLSIEADASLGQAPGSARSLPNAVVMEVSAQVCPLPRPEPIMLRTVIRADGAVGGTEGGSGG